MATRAQPFKVGAHLPGGGTTRNTHLRARAIRQIRGAMAAALELIAAEGEREERRLLGKQTYPPPSEPGQPPAKRTGLLRDEIDHDVDEKKLTARIGILGTGRPEGYYLRFLELGTEKMRPRPSLRPMAVALDRKIIPHIKRMMRLRIVKD